MSSLNNEVYALVLAGANPTPTGKRLFASRIDQIDNHQGAILATEMARFLQDTGDRPLLFGTMRALEALNQKAAAAAPKLAELFWQNIGDIRKRAAEVLSKLGSTGETLLLQAMRVGSSEEHRYTAAIVMRRLPQYVSASLSVLRQIAQNTRDGYLREHSVEHILLSASETAIPILVNLLSRNPTPATRKDILLGLQQLWERGLDISPSFPFLLSNLAKQPYSPENFLHPWGECGDLLRSALDCFAPDITTVLMEHPDQQIRAKLTEICRSFTNRNRTLQIVLEDSYLCDGNNETTETVLNSSFDQLFDDSFWEN